MRVLWAVTNNAFVVMLGGAIIDINGKRFFDTKEELNDWLRPLGLKVSNSKVLKAED